MAEGGAGPSKHDFLPLQLVPTGWGRVLPTLALIQGEPLTTSDGDESWWHHRQLFSNFLWCWGYTQDPNVGQAGITWLHGSPGWQLSTFSYLGQKPIPRSYWG